MQTLTLIYRGDIYEVIFDPGPPPVVVEVLSFIDTTQKEVVEWDSLDYDLQEKIEKAIQ